MEGERRRLRRWYQLARGTANAWQAGFTPTNGLTRSTVAITTSPFSRSGDPIAWPLFLNINDDVCFLQFFLQTLIVPPQLLVFGGQRIPLRLRTPLLRKGFVYRAIALFTLAMQGRRINPFPPQNGSNTTAIHQGLVGLL